jgi:hypothetical protein
MASLDSVLRKIDHAKLHLERIKSETDRYHKTNENQFVPEANSPPNQPRFRVKPKFPIPDEIALFVGDCLQNLRSALDYLVWELVLSAKNTPDKKNMFLVCLTAKSFQDAQSARLHGVDPGAVALIESIQPYHDGQPSATSLAILDELTNINKHRHLLLTEFGTLSITEMLDDLNTYLSGSHDLSALVHNTGFNRVVTAEQMQVQSDLIPFVAFNEGAVTGMDVAFALDALIIYVSLVVQNFSNFIV